MSTKIAIPKIITAVSILSFDLIMYQIAAKPIRMNISDLKASVRAIEILSATKPLLTIFEILTSNIFVS
ncbi:MAG: hypothetical protein EOO89_24845 [Pedobacter sp.]|nr:MAG: hypothetical protein EOO89_24845 [Pedobacter sp.]